MPKGTTPGVAGVFEFHGRETTFRAQDGVSVTQDGKPIETVKLEMGEKHAIRVNELTLWVHYSGDRLAIRIRDLNSPIRKNFAGLEWFPVNETYRVTAKFVPHDAPREIEMLNILGDVERFETRGYVYFELDGESIRMEPVLRQDGGLRFVFRDGTKRGRVLSGGAIPERRLSRGRQGGHRLQSSLQSPLRIQPLHYLPNAHEGQSTQGAYRGGREELQARAPVRLG